MNTKRRASFLRSLTLGVGLLAFAGCAHEDPKPARPERSGLGNEIFGVLCERVGAQALREDLSGSSYKDVCHGSAETVDVARLPSAPDPDVRARAIAKIEALARHRPALIAALDVVFPDDTVVGKNLDAADPVASCDPISGKPRREQLRGLLGRLLPTDNETVPESSRAAARSIEPLMEGEGEPSRKAMMRLSARRGYMPPELSAGLLGTVLTAPRLRDMLGATTELLAEDGRGHADLQRFVVELKKDLEKPLEPQEKPLVIGENGALSRPRTAVELVQKVLLAEDPAFSNGPPLFVARRDPRGMAVVKKEGGKLPAPFVDKDDDGLADLDARGRFATKEPVSDPFVGDKRTPAFEYVDARSTAASALLRHISVLADPDGGQEAILNAFEGLEPLLRDREALLDLVHAGAQLAAEPSADELLELIGQLFKKEPQLMARILGNLLDAKAILDAHPEAELPKDSTLVDDLAVVLVKISREPQLLEEVLASMADPRASHLAKALPPLLSFNDRMTYDRTAINGLPMNLTTGKGGPPETLVDRSKPNTGWNRSIFQRFLQLVHDGNGVTVCNKEGGVLHSVISPDGGATYAEMLYPFTCACENDVCSCAPPTPECHIFKIENVSVFYMQSIVGAAKLHFRSDILTPYLNPESIRRSTGLSAMWDSATGEDIRPKPELLNRLVFFDVKNDSPKRGDPNFLTNFAIRDLQGPVGTSVCTARSIDDPNVGDPDVAPDKKIHGLRTCQEGQYLDQRDGDTVFALEYNHGYEAMAPLIEVFVKHKKEALLVELLEVLHKHWSMKDGVSKAEPALAEILRTDLVSSLGLFAKATNGKLDGPRVLAQGLRVLLDREKFPATDRRGKNDSLFSLFREALRAEDAVLERDKKRHAKWLAARSKIVDEFLSVKGRGADAQFLDPGIPQITPVIIDLLRAQRDAECRGDKACPAFRKDAVVDIEKSLKSPLTKATLDLVDTILADDPTRLELGRMTSYLTRQEGPLAGAGGNVSPSSTPFGTMRGPGVLDQSIAALVDALGALGDLSDLRAFYPFLSHALEDLDPQLSLLKRLNTRVYDEAGNEICALELDPEETIRNTLSRLAIPVEVEGQPKRPALQIFLEAIADVNRIDAANTEPLEPDDYANVFRNAHDLLTDPEGGLEQLYASVRRATEK